MLSLITLFRSLGATVSGDAALQDVAVLSQHHRIQASPGYRAAAQYVATELQSAGLLVRTLSYPANTGAHYWSLGGWQEWECQEATLHLLSQDGGQELICDFRSSPTSVIQRSASFDGEADVVLLEDGTEPQHFEGLDVRGRLVLSDGGPDQVYELAVAERGALGILCDRMEARVPGRSKLDMPDLRRYTSFWWAKEHEPCFGFVLTPRQGERLRRMLKPGAGPEGQRGVRVKAHVVARLYDGAMEVVEARLPGRTPEEVIIVAHLCHPQPSAHDNASGCAAAIEAARALRALIGGGALGEMKRSVRFLFVPEINGTYAYLAEHEGQLGNWIAGLNLDMVGGDQRKVGCTFTLERPPEALPSFAPDLLERLRLSALPPCGVRVHGGQRPHPLLRSDSRGADADAH
jgi:aminopeptidase YwaD